VSHKVFLKNNLILILPSYPFASDFCYSIQYWNPLPLHIHHDLWNPRCWHWTCILKK